MRINMNQIWDLVHMDNYGEVEKNFQQALKMLTSGGGPIEIFQHEKFNQPFDTFYTSKEFQEFLDKFQEVKKQVCSLIKK